MDRELANKPALQILWVDLEMTGLDPEKDAILEVAAIATDWDFNELGTYQGVIQADEMTLEERLEANAVFWDANPVVRDGLVGQNSDGKTIETIEDELLAFIGEHFSSDRPVLLAGNSIHMDRRFIERQWPRLNAKLHYRMLDVSAWKVVFEGKLKTKFMKTEAHRALDDIHGSIEELKFYLRKAHLSPEE